MSVLRPLPPRPSLEFEKKEAKALLRRLRTGDADTLARARDRHPEINAADPARIRLADAQLVIARDYGFASWPRLVRYYTDVERLLLTPRLYLLEPPNHYDGRVRGLIAGHRERSMSAGRAIAAYVPRFYGMRLEEVFASTITEDEARLAMARMNGRASWEELLEHAAASQRLQTGDWDISPMHHASKAMERASLDDLRRITEAHSELLDSTKVEPAQGGTVLKTALHHERRNGAATMRPIVDWLVAQGFDLQHELDQQLCGHMGMKAEKVQWLLDRGANPNYVAPNGIPVLEHALIRYWNGAAADLIAARAKPRKALWIAAGLGDVDGVRRSLDAEGHPRPAAYKLRPDFDAVGQHGLRSHPDPDDEELLMEAFFIAVLNARSAVVEYMVARGFNVDSLVYGLPVVTFAVGNAMVAMVECLVRCGANIDIAGTEHSQTARETARELFEGDRTNADRRRIVELCGMDPDVVLAKLDATPANLPVAEQKFEEALELASDDAVRLGQSETRPENLFYGLLRSGGLPLMFATRVSGMDRERFHADVHARILASEDRIDHALLPLRQDADAMVRAGILFATERRRETVSALHILHALTKPEDGVVAEILARYGANVAKLNAELERSL